MSLLLLFAGGSGAASVTPIAFGKTLALLMPDESGIGQVVNIYAEAFDNTGTYALDEAAQIYINGFTTGGVRTSIVGPVVMSQVAASNLWTYAWTPAAQGTYEVVVVVKQATVAYPVVRALTIRPTFDPISFALDDVLVSRMGNDATLGTA